MAKLATTGTIEVAPGRKDQLLPLLMAHRARCLKDEPGTMQFEVLAPHADDKEFSCTTSTMTTPHAACIGTDCPSHGGKKRLADWWERFP